MAAIMQVMDAAKKIMRQSGNMHQWGEGYPSEAVIMSDIEKDGGFVIEDGGKEEKTQKEIGLFLFPSHSNMGYSVEHEGIR